MRALVIRFSALGDVVQTTAVVEILTRLGYAVDYLTDTLFAPLLAPDPRLQRVFHFPRRDRRARARVLAEIASRGPYDLLLDLHGKLLSRWVALRLPARRKISLRKASLLRRMWIRRGRLPDREVPMVMRMWQALRRVEPRVPFSPPILRARYPSPLEEPGVVVVPFAARPLRNWPALYAYRLAAQLEEAGIPATLAGQGPIVDWPVPARNLMNETDLPHYAGLLQRARLVVTVDTSAAHMAAAFGVPVVELWGPTHPRLGMRPMGRGPVFSLGLPLSCRPCSLHGEGTCRRGDHACLRDLEPGRVFSLVRTLLKEKTSCV